MEIVNITGVVRRSPFVRNTPFMDPCCDMVSYQQLILKMLDTVVFDTMDVVMRIEVK